VNSMPWVWAVPPVRLSGAAAVALYFIERSLE